MKSLTKHINESNKGRFELYIYDGSGGGRSVFYDHLEDVIEEIAEWVIDDEEMITQYNAYDHKYNKLDITHNIGEYIMYEKIYKKMF